MKGVATGEEQQQLRALTAEQAKLLRQARKTELALRERVKEHNCLCRIGGIVEMYGHSLPLVLEKIAADIPDSCRHPESACARICLQGKEYATPNFKESPWGLSADILIARKPAGKVEVRYLEEMPTHDNGPFLAEEKILIEAIAKRVGGIAERMLAQASVAEHQRQLRVLASELSLAEERERRRIATELHDRISQGLNLVSMDIGELLASNMSPELRKPLLAIRQSIDQANDDTQTLTFELSSPILYELGLEAGIEWLADQIQKKSGVRTAFTDDGKPKPLADDVRLFLYQAVRELLNNVARHARARGVAVNIARRGDEVYVRVEDDGCGFDPARRRPAKGWKSGFGLFNIRERMAQIGGRLEIDAAPGKGTRTTLVAPVKQTDK